MEGAISLGDGATRRRISDERVEDILDVAAEVFFERGFEAASVGEMARRAHCSKATFYRRYPTKEALFEGIVRRQTDLEMDVFRKSFEGGLGLEDALTRFGGALLDFMLRPDFVALVRLLYMESQRFPQLGRVFYELGYERVLRLLTIYLDAQVVGKRLEIAQVRLAAEQFTDGLVGEPTRRAALGAGSILTGPGRSLRVRLAVRSFLRAYAVR